MRMSSKSSEASSNYETDIADRSKKSKLIISQTQIYNHFRIRVITFINVKISYCLFQILPVE